MSRSTSQIGFLQSPLADPSGRAGSPWPCAGSELGSCDFISDCGAWGLARGTGSWVPPPCGSRPSTGWRSLPASSGAGFPASGTSGEACVTVGSAGGRSPAATAVVKCGEPSEREADGLWGSLGSAGALFASEEGVAIANTSFPYSAATRAGSVTRPAKPASCSTSGIGPPVAQSSSSTV
jgi:hypothetical protein